jgi:two-component system response regulator DevR
MLPNMKHALQVLVVDDSPAIIERMMLMLGEIPGVHVTGWAVDSSSAVWALQQQALDAVVLDLHLGDDNALDILARFRAAMPATKFIIFTNYAQPPMQRACMKAGADYFFDKSNDFQQLVDLLTSMAAEQEPEPEYSA